MATRIYGQPGRASAVSGVVTNTSVIDGQITARLAAGATALTLPRNDNSDSIATTKYVNSVLDITPTTNGTIIAGTVKGYHRSLCVLNFSIITPSSGVLTVSGLPPSDFCWTITAYHSLGSYRAYCYVNSAGSLVFSAPPPSGVDVSLSGSYYSPGL